MFGDLCPLFKRRQPMDWSAGHLEAPLGEGVGGVNEFQSIGRGDAERC